MLFRDQDGRIEPRVQLWLCIALADLFLFEGLGDFFLSPSFLNRFIAILQILAVPGWLYGAWCGYARLRHRRQSLFVLDRPYSSRMPANTYTVEASKTHPGCYAVAAPHSLGGEMCTALFLGPNSQERAKEFADWKNSSAEVLRPRKTSILAS